MPKTPTSSKKRNRRVVLSDGTEINTDDSKGGNIRRGKKAKHVVPKEKQSTEMKRASREAGPDKYDDLKYPPPRRDKEFRQIWADGIDGLTGRPNFNETHLGIFEVLCALYVDLRDLDKFIAENGHTYRTVNVMGEQRKTHPEVIQKHKTLDLIHKYTRMLDLQVKPSKKPSSGGASEAEADEEDWA